MTTITLTAPDISCDHCKQTVEREVGALSGVRTVSVDVPTKQVSVTFDDTATSRAEIESTLDDAGYPVNP
jgi:copper ion binding protein